MTQPAPPPLTLDPSLVDNAETCVMLLAGHSGSIDDYPHTNPAYGPTQKQLDRAALWLASSLEGQGLLRDVVRLDKQRHAALAQARAAGHELTGAIEALRARVQAVLGITLAPPPACGCDERDDL